MSQDDSQTQVDWLLVAIDLAEAIRLTREYVGEDKLPALEGWSWFDAMQKYEAAMAAEDEAANPATWSCKIGETWRSGLPPGSDGPMRNAVEAAYRDLTGEDPDFVFSGWGAKLTEHERAVAEDREPQR